MEEEFIEFHQKKETNAKTDDQENVLIYYINRKKLNKLKRLEDFQ